MVSVLGVENQAVSLAACHLLQVMFDALKEGVKKGFRGKEGALIVGEWRRGRGRLGLSWVGRSWAPGLLGKWPGDRVLL